MEGWRDGGMEGGEDGGMEGGEDGGRVTPVDTQGESWLGPGVEPGRIHKHFFYLDLVKTDSDFANLDLAIPGYNMEFAGSGSRKTTSGSG